MDGPVLLVQVDNLVPIVLNCERSVSVASVIWRPVWIHGAFVESERAVYRYSLEQNHEARLLEIPQRMFGLRTKIGAKYGRYVC